MVVSAQKRVERWDMGMRYSPFIKCPTCGKKTRAPIKCQWCKTQWTNDQIELRAKERRKIISSYPQNQP